MEDSGYKRIQEEASHCGNSVFFPGKNASSLAWVPVPLGPRAIATIVMKTQTHLAFLEAEIASKHSSPTCLHHRKNMAWKWQ